MKKLAISALVMMSVAGGVHAAGDPAAGKTKAATCAACHGPDGNSPNNPIWPKLAGQHASYIVKQLQAFKSGARQDPTMQPMAAPLSEEDMADLAAYFSSQSTAIGSADPEQAAAGEKLYKGGDPTNGVTACIACHGPSGSGNGPAGFASLSGQHRDYVVKALKDFRSGKRDTDPAAMMRNVAAKMSDQQIEAVAEYIVGLH